MKNLLASATLVIIASASFNAFSATENNSSPFDNPVAALEHYNIMALDTIRKSGNDETNFDLEIMLDEGYVAAHVSALGVTKYSHNEIMLHMSCAYQAQYCNITRVRMY